MLDRAALVDAAKTLLKVSLGTDYYYACAAARDVNDFSIIRNGVDFPPNPINLMSGGPDVPPERVFDYYDSLKTEIDPIYDAYAKVLNKAIGITFTKDKLKVFQSQLSGLFCAEVGVRPVNPTHRDCWAEEHQGRLQINVEFSKDQRESFIVRGYSMPHNHLFQVAQPERNVA